MHARRRQRGIVSSLVAVVVLLVTLLAAIALIRSVDTSNTVAGTIAFKQSAVQEAEIAYKEVLLNVPSFTGAAGLGEADNSAIGYYAEIQPVNSHGVPTALVNGTGKTPAVATPDTVLYVIERLCPTAGPALTVAPNQCLVPSATVTGGSTTGNQGGFSAGALAGFRLTVRIQNPKGMVTYVQTMLH
jgi:Tfp pilus assembly protein PilX